MIINFDKQHIDQVERSIRPPLRLAVTIPVEYVQHGKIYQAVIYVGASEFASDNVSAKDLQEIASRLTVQES